MANCALCGGPVSTGLVIHKDCLRRLERDLKDCRNELCLKCGEYKQRHMGACDGCRWNQPFGGDSRG